LLPQTEFEQLHREERCFRCKIESHLSRNCSQNEQETSVEALAAHFAEEDESDDNNESSEDYVGSDDGAQNFERSEPQYYRTDEGIFSSSEEMTD
jgi:hypothetical protein